MGLIWWIVIGIFCFYLLRNFYVSVVMIPLGNQILNTYNRPLEKRPFLKISPAYRNYYLLVLNPFRWHFLEIFKNDHDGRKTKSIVERMLQRSEKFKKFKVKFKGDGELTPPPFFCVTSKISAFVKEKAVFYFIAFW